MSTILAIAAHPGDALFTMGATVAQHIHAGGNGVFLNLTLGEKGHPTIPTREYGEMQRAATEKAAAMIGAGSEFLPFRDAEIPASEDAALAVCDSIRKHRPAIVITHWKGSWHKDHRNTYQIVRDAMFYAELRSLPREAPAHPMARLFFADNWEDADDYRPDVLLETTAIHQKWAEACALFPMWRGETGLIRYHDYYLSLARMRGCLGGFEYAVALMSDPEQQLKRIRSLDEHRGFL
jgi:LmbE family N-acetylglucosaminyl deacetylase